MKCVRGNAHRAEDDSCLTNQVGLLLGWYSYWAFVRNRDRLGAGVGGRSEDRATPEWPFNRMGVIHDGELKMKTFLATLAAATTIMMNTANADAVYVGWWNENVGGGVTQIPQYYGGQDGSLHTFSAVNFGPSIYNMSGNISTVSFTSGGTHYYEVTITDVHSSLNGYTRIYATWTNITAPLGQLTFPITFEAGENQPGWTIIEQVFVCSMAQGAFCDNLVYPGADGLKGYNFGSTPSGP